jgi:hypothetical protein
MRTFVRMTHSVEVITRTRALCEKGLSTSEIARQVRVPRPGRAPAAVRLSPRGVPRRWVPVGAPAGRVQAADLAGRALPRHSVGMRARDCGRHAAQPHRTRQPRRLARTLCLFEELALPLPTAWAWPEARAEDRADAVAARSARALAGAHGARPDPLRRLSVRQHRAGVVASALLVRQPVNRNPRNRP